MEHGQTKDVCHFTYQSTLQKSVGASFEMASVGFGLGHGVTPRVCSRPSKSKSKNRSKNRSGLRKRNGKSPCLLLLLYSVFIDRT